MISVPCQYEKVLIRIKTMLIAIPVRVLPVWERHRVNWSYRHGTDIISCQFHLEAKKCRKWDFFSFRKARQFLENNKQVGDGQIEIIAALLQINLPLILQTTAHFIQDVRVNLLHLF